MQKTYETKFKHLDVFDSLNKVMQLRGITYTQLANNEHSDPGVRKKRQLGLIAQEVKDVVPEVVDMQIESGMYGIEYANLTALLIEAIKDLKRENDAKDHAFHEELRGLREEIREIRKLKQSNA